MCSLSKSIRSSLIMMANIYHVPDTLLSALHELSHFVFRYINDVGNTWYFDLTDEETGTQVKQFAQGYTASKSELDSNPYRIDFGVCLLTSILYGLIFPFYLFPAPPPSQN